MNKYMKKNTVYYSAFFLIILLTAILLVTSVFFLIGLHINYLTIVLSFVISVLFVVLYKKNEKLKPKILGMIIGIIIIITFSFISGNYFDFSWDGNTYHKDAVGALKNGWNPIHENYIDFYKNSGLREDGIIGDKIIKERGLWQTHYAKGIWIISANFYYLFKDIEMSKIFNLLILYISLVFSYFFIRKFSNKKILSIFLALCFSLSPIVLAQIFTYYNDGALYSALLISLLSFILLIKDDKDSYIWLFSSLVLVCNIKFTGLCYTGFMLLFLYIAYLLLNRKDMKKVIKPTLFLVFTVFISVFIVGFNPYVKNTISNGNPFYPLMGKDKVDIMTHNSPRYFENRNRIEKLIISLASKSNNINRRSTENPKFKVPFSIEKKELNILKEPDLRIAGFGVWFFPVLVISSLVILYYLIIFYKKDKKSFLILSMISLSIVLLCLIIKESWWARYSPYIYLVPCISLFLLLLYFKNSITKVFYYIISSILLVNIVIYGVYSLKVNHDVTIKTKELLKEYENKEIAIIETGEPFLGVLYNLDDNKIKYSFEKNDKKSEIDTIYGKAPYMRK